MHRSITEIIVHQSNTILSMKIILLIILPYTKRTIKTHGACHNDIRTGITDIISPK